MVKGATAIIASLGIISAAQQAGQPQSQALVEVKSENLIDRSKVFQRDFDFVHNEELKILPPIGGGDNPFSLEETYLNFDVRDSYLTRQATPMSNEADAIIISNEDYETKTCNIWRSQDSSKIYTSSAASAPGEESSTALDFYTGMHSTSDKVSLLL